jgi:ribosomal protein S18 acetylase RimI-like enzyme
MSPWNPFYRPFANDFPEDVEKSYLQEQQGALGHKRKLFTVVEIDNHRRVSEDTKVSKQVVGFAIWNFTSSQTRGHDPIPVDLSESEDRSVDKYRGELLFGATESSVERCLQGHMELDNMAVDPDHFRRGYGTLLCTHGMDIARKDKVPVGVVAAEMGTYLYNSLGFKTTVKVTVTDPRPGKLASVDFWVQKWNATDSE